MELVILCLVAGMVFLLQPSGQMSNFQKWQYQPSEKSSAPPTLEVKFFGVSTLLFEDGQTQILIDGFFSHPYYLKSCFRKLKVSLK